MSDMEAIFVRVDGRMKRDRLYLDPWVTLSSVARYSGTNRVYVCRAVKTRFPGFRDYVNGMRLEHLLKDIRSGRCGSLKGLDADDFARSYGFKSKKGMDRQLVRVTGSDYRHLTCRHSVRPKRTASG